MNRATTIISGLIVFSWLLASTIMVVVTGGAALPMILNLTGLLFASMAIILRFAMYDLDSNSLEYRIMETTALILDIIGLIFALSGAIIGGIATRSGTLASRICARFASNTRIGRFISSRTLAYTGMQTSSISRTFSSRTLLDGGRGSIELTTPRSLTNLSNISSLERTFTTNSSRYCSVASSLNSEYFDALSSVPLKL